MRAPSIYTRERTGLDIPMTPLIDVVFQLLVFFLLTASFHAAEHLLPSSVSAPQAGGAGSPTETPPPEDDFDQVVVRILWTDGQPAWQVNGQSLGGLEEVRTTLAAVARTGAVVEVTAAVKEAVGRLEPFDQVGVSQAKVERVASSRRILTPEGKIIVRMSSTTDAKLHALPEGDIVDTEVIVIPPDDPRVRPLLDEIEPKLLTGGNHV